MTDGWLLLLLIAALAGAVMFGWLFGDVDFQPMGMPDAG